jgi:cytochrome c5
MNYAAPVTLALVLALGTAATSAAQPYTSTARRAAVLGAIEVPRDTPPTGAAKPSGKGFKVSKLEYEGWRQYSANCTRCHGQDVLPNPVAADLLLSLGRVGRSNRSICSRTL